MQYQGAQPVESPVAAQAAGSATPSITALTIAAWIKLFSFAVTYVTQAATTPVVTITFQDGATPPNILWRKTAAALTAAATNVISMGGGLPDNTATPTAQQLGFPTDMVLPPGSKIVVSATAANAADTIATVAEYTL
jgi:hypothetical protein